MERGGKEALLQKVQRRLGLKGRRGPLAVLIVAAAASCAIVLGMHLAEPALTIKQDDGAQGAASEVQTDAGQSSDGSASASDPVLVDIDGAVAHPGVYDLAGTTLRVKDAVNAAGGTTDDADTATLNLAAAVTDGTKIHVPTKDEASAATTSSAAATQTGTSTSGTSSSSGSASSSSASASSKSSGQTPALVNINTATAEELETLPGVGESTANAIIQDRNEHGAFSSKEDLMRVSGIGEKKYAKLEASICV